MPRATSDLRAKSPGPNLLLAAVWLATFASAQAADAGDEQVQRRALLMGTILDVHVEADSRAAALAASEAVLSAVAGAEARLSTWTDDSELARWQDAPVGDGYAISDALAGDLETAFACRSLTSGAFDPTVASLVAAWGLRQGGRRPHPDELRAALAAVGTSATIRQRAGQARWVATRDEGLRVDEGGFGKGAALDDALAALAAEPAATSAVLDFGGQLAVYRSPAAAADAYPIAVAHPDHRQLVVARFSIASGSVATTGNGERGLVVDGERIGHVLDPRTGLPARDFGSLTVWVDPARFAPARGGSRTGAATFADCLSTGLYVLGPDAALDWAEAVPGVEVLVVERLANSTAAGEPDIRVRASSGLAASESASLTTDFDSVPIAGADRATTGR